MTPLVLISLLSGAIGATLALRRGRSPWAWFFIGLFFGLIGVLFIFFLPQLKDGKAITRKMPSVLDDTHTTATTEKVTDPMLWHYLDATHQPQEPVSFEALSALWSEGKISGKTYVWTKGMSEWKEIEGLPELQSRLL